MHQILSFISKNSTRLLFLVLLVTSLSLTIQTHSYHRGKAFTSANAISGTVYEKTHAVEEYMGLKYQNDILAKENAKLKQILYNSQIILDSNFHIRPDLRIASEYKTYSTKIINNNYLKKENYLTIRGGSNQGFSKDMGVINSRGVVGIVEKVSKNYATVQSILNTKTKIGAKVRNTDHFGTIIWDGKNAGYVQLIDVPKLAQLHKGDSIVTGGISTIFPENIPIGIIDKVFTSKASNFYTISVRLFNDMTNINHIYILENVHIEEIQQLEEDTINE